MMTETIQKKLQEIKATSEHIKLERQRIREKADEIRAANKPFVKHVRDSKGRPIGTMVVAALGNQFMVGWSKCNPLDVFDRHSALVVAWENARIVKYPWLYLETPDARTAPRLIQKALPSYLCRIEKHYMWKERYGG